METINKTEEDKENELQWKVSFVKKGMYTQRISQVDVQEMLKRGWITEQEFKNYGWICYSLSKRQQHSNNSFSNK